MRISDWSSDVCSSDLATFVVMAPSSALRPSRSRITTHTDSSRFLRPPVEFGVLPDDAGLIGEEGEVPWPGAKNRRYRMQSWTSFWLGRTRRRRLTPEACSTG